MSAPAVIAFAGPPGSGKTALIAALRERLPASTVLFLDGFDNPATSLSRDELAAWLRGGTRFEDFVVPGLAQALAALRAGQAVVEPLSGRPVPPGRPVLFEMPLGRTHLPTAAMIDLLVWLDTPPDVALARNLLAWERQIPPPPRAWLERYAGEYLALTRDVLGAQATAVAGHADIRLDGMAPVAEAAGRLMIELQHRGLVE